MKNQIPSTKLNDDYKKKSQSDIQKRFIDLQFKRSELEIQLQKINKILYSLGREMEDDLAYDQLYK